MKRIVQLEPVLDGRNPGPRSGADLIAANARSFTGQYLKETLAKAPKTPSPLAREGQGEGARKRKPRRKHVLSKAEGATTTDEADQLGLHPEPDEGLIAAK